MPEKKQQPTSTAPSNASGGQTFSQPVYVQQPVEEHVCEVCGHINRGPSLICAMCSNYLFKK